MPRIITKPSAALRAAAKRIKADESRYTCDALWWCHVEGRTDPATQLACERYIGELLREHGHLESWLQAHVPECQDLDLWTPRNARKVKQTRLAWIEWMAQQFEAQGR